MNSALRLGTLLAIGLTIGIPASGCSRVSKPEVVDVKGTATQGRLSAVAWLYTLHVDLKRRPPANFDELRIFAETLPATHGGPSSLSQEFLISPRDKKPIVIRYGLPLRANQRGPVVIAHEQEGLDGRRFVVYAGSHGVEEVDDARFKELVP